MDLQLVDLDLLLLTDFAPYKRSVAQSVLGTKAKREFQITFFFHSLVCRKTLREKREFCFDNGEEGRKG